MFNNFFPKNRVIYEIMLKITVQPDRPKMTVTYGACALHAGKLRLHSEYVILITLPREHWLRERAWMLRFTGTLPVLRSTVQGTVNMLRPRGV
jgi:hypothetical protein